MYGPMGPAVGVEENFHSLEGGNGGQCFGLELERSSDGLLDCVNGAAIQSRIDELVGRVTTLVVCPGVAEDGQRVKEGSALREANRQVSKIGQDELSISRALFANLVDQLSGKVVMSSGQGLLGDAEKAVGGALEMVLLVSDRMPRGSIVLNQLRRRRLARATVLGR